MVERIPYADLEIAPGWKLATLTTLEQCHEADIHLTRDIAAIESQLDEYEQDNTVEPPDDEAMAWARKARSALKIKHVMRGIVRDKGRALGRVAS